MSRLFEPIKVGSVALDHRIALAPLTRFRMDDTWKATTMSREYYEQRSCVKGTLLISEATIIAKNAAGRHNVPGIWSEEQIAAWREITTTVHDKGCYIYCQLWHQGRDADPEILRSHGLRLVSSSAIPINAERETPEEMSEGDILETIENYAAAARNAIAAGFDGVEIHGANGYLPDQFLQSTCNKRSDRWGGSIEGRSRFHLEVTKAVIAAVGSHRTAIRLSPYSDFNGMLMDEPEPTFSYLLDELRPLNLAYLHLIEARIKGNHDSDCGGQKSVAWMVEQWDNAGPIVLAGGWTSTSATEAVNTIYKDHEVIIAFGRYFVSNPDLVYRVREGVPLIGYDRTVFYTPKLAKGYIDYPYSAQYLQTAASG